MKNEELNQDSQFNFYCKEHSYLINHLKLESKLNPTKSRLGCWQCLDQAEKVIFWNQVKEKYIYCQTQTNKLIVENFKGINVLEENIQDLISFLKNDYFQKGIDKLNEIVKANQESIQFLKDFSDFTTEDLQSFAEYLSDGELKKKIEAQQRNILAENRYKIVELFRGDAQSIYKQFDKIQSQIKQIVEFLKDNFSIQENKNDEQIQIGTKEVDIDKLNLKEILEIPCAYANHKIIRFIDLGQGAQKRAVCSSCTNTIECFSLEKCIEQYKDKLIQQKKTNLTQKLKIIEKYKIQLQPYLQTLDMCTKTYQRLNQIEDQINQEEKDFYKIKDSEKLEIFCKQIYELTVENDKLENLNNKQSQFQLLENDAMKLFSDFILKYKIHHQQFLVDTEKFIADLIKPIKSARIYAKKYQDEFRMISFDNDDKKYILVGKNFIELIPFLQENQEVVRKKVDFEIQSFCFEPKRQWFAVASNKIMRSYSILQNQEIKHNFQYECQENEQIVKLIAYSKGEDDYCYIILGNKFLLINLNKKLQEQEDSFQLSELVCVRAEQNQEIIVFGFKQKKNEYLKSFQLYKISKEKTKFPPIHFERNVFDYKILQDNTNGQKNRNHFKLFFFALDDCVLYNYEDFQLKGQKTYIIKINQAELFCSLSNQFFIIKQEFLVINFMKFLKNGNLDIIQRQTDSPQILLKKLEGNSALKSDCQIQVSPKGEFLVYVQNMELHVFSLNRLPEITQKTYN